MHAWPVLTTIPGYTELVKHLSGTVAAGLPPVPKQGVARKTEDVDLEARVRPPGTLPQKYSTHVLDDALYWLFLDHIMKGSKFI